MYVCGKYLNPANSLTTLLFPKTHLPHSNNANTERISNEYNLLLLIWIDSSLSDTISISTFIHPFDIVSRSNTLRCVA